MMVRRYLLAAAVAIAGVVTASAQRAADADALLQRANHAQLVEGNLRQAIQLYEQVLKLPKLDRGKATTALLRVAECYEKLGHDQARATYERIVRDFPDVPQAVADARSALARLVPAARADITARRLYGDTIDPTSGDVTRDGRFATFTDYVQTGNLMWVDLTTRQARPLTHKKTFADSVEYAEASRISPDGKSVAYTWMTTGLNYELRIVPAAGGPPRTVFAQTTPGHFVGTHDWSPDGTQLLITIGRDALVNELALIDVATGAIHRVKIFGTIIPWVVRFSPDGKFIAYDIPQAKTSREHDVYTLHLDTGQETAVVEHPAHDQLMAWPDNGRLLFKSDRLRSQALFSMAVSNGQPGGSPQLIKDSFDVISPLRMTNGSLYYAASASATDIYLATLDSEAQRVLEPPASIGERYIGGGTRWFGTWSNSGDMLALTVADRRGLSRGFRVKNLKTGASRDVPMEVSFARELKWSADDRSFFFAGRDLEDRQGLYRADAVTGKTTTLAQGYLTRDIAVAPDGNTIYHAQRGPGASGVFARDLRTGEARELFKGLVGGLDLSPDGAMLALFGNFGPQDGSIDGISLLPVAGGEPRPIFAARNTASDNIASVRWSGNGKHLVFARGENLSEVWSIAIDSGEAKPTGIKLDRITYISMNRANRLAITSGVVKAEIWVLEGLK